MLYEVKLSLTGRTHEVLVIAGKIRLFDNEPVQVAQVFDPNNYVQVKKK